MHQSHSNWIAVYLDTNLTEQEIDWMSVGLITGSTKCQSVQMPVRLATTRIGTGAYFINYVFHFIALTDIVMI